MPLKRLKALQKRQREGGAGPHEGTRVEDSNVKGLGDDDEASSEAVDESEAAAVNHTLLCTDAHVDCRSWAIAGLCKFTNASDAHQHYRMFVSKTCCWSCRRPG